MNSDIKNNNNYSIETDLNKYIYDMNYNLYCKINQSIVMAENYLKNNRPFGIFNNVVKINGQNIDMYYHLIVKNNLKEGEFSLVALSGDHNMWFARKTHDNLIQYFYFTVDNSYYQEELFDRFIQDYKQRITI
jgi:hypothetical protein